MAGGFEMSKNKKRKNSGQWIGVLIYMLIGAACGILILRYMDLIAGEVPVDVFHFVGISVELYVFENGIRGLVDVIPAGDHRAQRYAQPDPERAGAGAAQL